MNRPCFPAPHQFPALRSILLSCCMFHSFLKKIFIYLLTYLFMAVLGLSWGVRASL